MGRIPNGKLPEKRFDFSPDLAVEVLSPTDISFDVEAKIQEYLDAGTQIVWLAKPKSRRISVYRPDGTEVTFGPNDTITAEPVLPGFSMRVGDVFPT
jgi:Uma2 family endonuclease